MERHHVRLLPVLDETGRLLGLLSEAHILAAWGEDPPLPVAETFTFEEEGGKSLSQVARLDTMVTVVDAKSF
ncbi:CBS domain-containing protein, partial [Stigmatella aurantiaca]|uniref:CBS domain-containing protein n=1 Tax=Stigmatella aurantiaca TaxID=41 RepID=UPI000AAB5094